MWSKYDERLTKTSGFVKTMKTEDRKMRTELAQPESNHVN